MKQYAFLFLVMTLILLIAPLSVFLPVNRAQEPDTDSPSVLTDESKGHDTAAKRKDKEDTISVFMTDDSETVTMSMRDYIIGVVAAEMPASYEAEALKAQALVAATYARYIKLHPDASAADITDSGSRHQGYITTDEMKEKWGDAFDSYHDRIAAAVDSVEGLIITSDGEPIMAAYHAISSGKTEDAQNLWGRDIAYLQSVDSQWDKFSSRYEAVISLTPDELKMLMKDIKSAVFSDNPEDWIEITDISPVGTVLGIRICGTEMTGSSARELLSLRSPVFDVSFSGDEFIFTVYGYGHGVGMSQNGANCMAKEGKTYEEIISHYYTGTEIEEY